MPGQLASFNLKKTFVIKVVVSNIGIVAWK